MVSEWGVFIMAKLGKARVSGASKWHVRPNGEVGRCTAKNPESCPFAAEGAEHFDSMSKAITRAEEVVAYNLEHPQSPQPEEPDDDHQAPTGTVPDPEEPKDDDSTQDTEHHGDTADEQDDDQAKRINSLLKTRLDPEGKLDHTKKLIWTDDPRHNMVSLSYYYGKQWMESNPTEEEKRRELTEALEALGLMDAASDSTIYFPKPGEKITADDLTGELDMTDFDSIRKGRVAKVVANCAQGIADRRGKASNTIDSIVMSDGKLRSKGPIVITSGRPYSSRSIFAKAATRFIPKISSNFVRGVDAPIGQRYHCTSNWDRCDISSIEIESLVGWNRIRKTIMDSEGIDIFSKPTDGDDISRAWKCINDFGMSEEQANLQATYDHNAKHGTIANAFTDKIKTSKQCEKAAAGTSLHDHFQHIEFDEDMDLTKLPQMENEIDIALQHLPKTSREVGTLRVRKLGKYRGNTLGVYNPNYNAIVLDDGKATRNGFSGMSSFIHEYAHHIDHTMEDGRMMSMSDDFRPVLEAINKDLSKQEGLTSSHRDYLKTPTEVFSRCFEWWAVKKLGVESSLTATKDEYEHATEYLAFNQHTELVDSVMSKLFPDMKGFNTLDKKQWKHSS